MSSMFAMLSDIIYSLRHAWCCPTHSFPFCTACAWYGEKQQKQATILDSPHNRILNFTRVCVTHLQFGIMIWTKWKVLQHHVVFSNTRLWRKETNMAIVGMMTCKIGLIWRHMKALYRALSHDVNREWWRYNRWVTILVTMQPGNE